MKVLKSLMFAVFTALIMGVLAGCGGGGGDGGNSGGGGVTGDYDWKWVVFHTGDKNEYLYSFVRPYEYTLAYPGNDTELFEDYLPDLAVAPVQEWPDYRGVDKMFLPQGSYTFCYEIFHPDSYSWTHRIIGSLPNDPAVVLSPSSFEEIATGVYVGDGWSQYDIAGACPIGGGGGGVPPPAESATLTIGNTGDASIGEAYISPSSSDSWGSNLLSSHIDPGKQRSFTINNCNKEYDFKVIHYTHSSNIPQETMGHYIECGKLYEWGPGWHSGGTTRTNISNDLKTYKKQIQ